MYALERGGRSFVLAFAFGCVLSSIYGFLSGAWPFGVVELICAGIAIRRYREPVSTLTAAHIRSRSACAARLCRVTVRFMTCPGGLIVLWRRQGRWLHRGRGAGRLPRPRATPRKRCDAVHRVVAVGLQLLRRPLTDPVDASIRTCGRRTRPNGVSVRTAGSGFGMGCLSRPKVRRSLPARDGRSKSLRKGG